MVARHEQMAEEISGDGKQERRVYEAKKESTRGLRAVEVYSTAER